jgi:hypothetical protein
MFSQDDVRTPVGLDFQTALHSAKQAAQAARAVRQRVFYEQ